MGKPTTIAVGSLSLDLKFVENDDDDDDDDDSAGILRIVDEKINKVSIHVMITAMRQTEEARFRNIDDKGMVNNRNEMETFCLCFFFKFD